MRIPTLPILFGAALLALPAIAQDADEQLKKQYESKLSAAFLKNSAWELDYDAARKQAKESGKPIFAYFTRSYAP